MIRYSVLTIFDLFLLIIRVISIFIDPRILMYINYGSNTNFHLLLKWL